MNQDLLQEILDCPSLPSLPAVAVKIIEFSGRQTGSLQQLAELIEKDQALAVKILRTVNSSFFGLSRPCVTISQAVVFLGQRQVRQLALTFSLVGVMKGVKADDFDFVAYWRRNLYSAVAARKLAAGRAGVEPEEAFLAALLQDLGQFALYRVLGERYAAVLRAAVGDHRFLAAAELAELDLQHAEVGASIAERWKFPGSIVAGIRYHDRATASPREHGDLCRCIALGNFAHDVLTDPEPTVAIDRLHTWSRAWFGLDAGAVDDVLAHVAEQARTLSPLLGVNTGPFADPREIVAQAKELRRRLSDPEGPQRHAA